MHSFHTRYQLTVKTVVQPPPHNKMRKVGATPDFKKAAGSHEGEEMAEMSLSTDQPSRSGGGHDVHQEGFFTPSGAGHGLGLLAQLPVRESTKSPPLRSRPRSRAQLLQVLPSGFRCPQRPHTSPLEQELRVPSASSSLRKTHRQGSPSETSKHVKS